mgnify:CR=1 FL=1
MQWKTAINHNIRKESTMRTTEELRFGVTLVPAPLQDKTRAYASRWWIVRDGKRIGSTGRWVGQWHWWHSSTCGSVHGNYSPSRTRAVLELLRTI